MSRSFSRRSLLGGVVTGLGTMALAGCDRIARNSSIDGWVRNTEHVTRNAQRALLARGDLAPEFSEADLSPVFKSNGTHMPGSDEYARLLAGEFTDWRLKVDGLVQRPLSNRLQSQA
jgi:DMSO/TMAO reductase YedYZ molybdopterin-dependent catalytic subunit